MQKSCPITHSRWRSTLSSNPINRFEGKAECESSYARQFPLYSPEKLVFRKVDRNHSNIAFNIGAITKPQTAFQENYRRYPKE